MFNWEPLLPEAPPDGFGALGEEPTPRHVRTESAPLISELSIFASTTSHISKGIFPARGGAPRAVLRPSLESQAQHAHLESKRDFPGVRVGMMWTGLR